MRASPGSTLRRSGIDRERRSKGIEVEVVVPHERWEVRFLPEGAVEVERFTSSGEVGGPEMLKELFDRIR